MRRLSAFRQFARAMDREVWAHLYGVPHPVRLYALRNGSYLVNRRSPEPRLTALVLAIMKTATPRHFWDVGAHIGYYSWLVAAASRDTDIVAIEPDPINLSVLQKTRTYSPRVAILDVGVSESDGTASFLTDGVSGATGTLEVGAVTFNERNYGEVPQSIGIRTRSLDSIGVERGFPDFVKMDVEGHEVHALGGGSQLLSRKPIVIVEVFDPSSPALTTLRDAGYHVLPADSLCDGPAPDDGNYVAVPDGRVDLESLRTAYARKLLDAGLTSAA